MDDENQVLSNEILNRLNRLEKVANVPIKNLAGKHLDDFRTLQNHTRLLYGTDDYVDYSRAARRIFQSKGPIIPGTVRAYFVGCLTQTSSPEGLDKACTAICAGSMPPPPQEGGARMICDSNVYMIKTKGTIQHLTLLASGEPSAKTILMIEDGIQDLDPAIKQNLLKQGINQVYIYRYSPDGIKMQEVGQGPIELEKISRSFFTNSQKTLNSRRDLGSNPRPPVQGQVQLQNKQSGGKNILLWIFLFAFFLIVIGLLFYFLYFKPRQQGMSG